MFHEASLYKQKLNAKSKLLSQNTKFMKKFFLMLAFLCAGSMLVQAQITTGESQAQTIKTGNRAEKGDFGLYLGATSTMFQDLTSIGDLKALPLINFKYMFNDKVEGRLGIEWWSKTTKDTEEFIEEDVVGTITDRTWGTNMKFYPGVAYHFAKSNVLDVYFGGELPFGWTKDGNSSESKILNQKLTSEISNSHFKIGLGAFFGLQAYVCNLPLAVGLEYGVSTLWNAGGETISADADNNVTVTTSDDALTWELGHQARLTLTYFFKL